MLCAPRPRCGGAEMGPLRATPGAAIAFPPQGTIIAPPLPRADGLRTQHIMPSVKIRDNEPFDIALRRFKRVCEKAGVLAESHRREYYEKPTQIRKRNAAAAVKRTQKQASRNTLRRRRWHRRSR